MMENFAEHMSRLAEMIVERSVNCHSEEQTKQSLIQPVIHELGYDIFNPSEVIMEYACDAPVLKSRNGKPESVDYAIRASDAISILIEAKDASENLDRHGGQLARYFMSTECRHAILTNGLEWRFFSDLDKDNVMDANPYRTIDMRSLSDEDIMFLSGFHKAKFSEEGLRNEAEKAMYASKINDYIKRNIIDDISDEIARVILGHVYDGIKSAAVVARFRPMISEELDKCVAGKYAIKSSLVRKTDKTSPSTEITTTKMEDAGGFAPSASEEAPTAPTFPIEVFFVSGDGAYDARGLYLGGNRITVLAGSKVARDEKPYLAENARNLRQRLVDENSIITEDVTIDSVSTAGAFVNGGTCDAGRQWKVADGRTILDVLGGRTWSEASRITEKRPTPIKSPSHDEATDANISEDESNIGIPIFMRTRHTGQPTSYDVTATYLGNKRCRLHVGSQCAKKSDNYTSKTARRLREEYLDENGIVIREFEGSISMVGAVVRGSTCDGTRRWSLADGRQIREILPESESEISNMPTDSNDENDEVETLWPIRMFYASTSRAAAPFSAVARVYEDGTTVVESGSVISSFTTPSLDKYAKAIREEELMKLTSENGRYVLSEDQEISFDSPSSAGKFVSGSSVNGKLVWRDKTGRRLGDFI